jgi:hypothetical protein
MIKFHNENFLKLVVLSVTINTATHTIRFSPYCSLDFFKRLRSPIDLSMGSNDCCCVAPFYVF